MAMDALLCSCEAIRAADAWAARTTADAALRPMCASLVDSASRLGLRPEMARALSSDFCRLGLFQCLMEMDKHSDSRHGGAALDDCLCAWIHIHFRSDARSYLTRLTLADMRSGMEALRALSGWAKPADHAAFERASQACSKASTFFWPDERDILARDAGALLALTAAASRTLLVGPGDSEPLPHESHP